MDVYQALDFLERFYFEVQPADDAPTFEQRLSQVRDEIATTGSYHHSAHELAFGAQLA